MKQATVLITGGARGIGLAIGRAVIGSGARAILWDADGRTLSDVAAELGAGVRVFEVDVSDPLAIERAAEACGDDWRPTHLVNNAGILGRKMVFDQMDAGEINRVLSVNVTGLLSVTSAFLRIRQAHSQAAVVNMASIAGVNGGATGHAVYGATKGATLALTRAMARDLAPDLRVNALAPGIIETDMQKGVFATEAAMKELAASIPQKRLGTPEDVADAAMWLLFGAPYTNGETIRVAGGRI